MISTDLAPNESWSDAILSLRTMLMPWRYYKGKQLKAAKSLLLKTLGADEQKYIISMFLSGRSALYSYLKSLKLPAESEVLLQAFTCAAVPMPIIEAGLKPVYIDIEHETFSMDFSDLQKKHTPVSRLLIVQYTYGFTPKYLEEILAFAGHHHLDILIDLAHGGDRSAVENAATQAKHLTILVSSGRSKPFSSVFGGAIISNDKSVSDELATLERALPRAPLGFLIKCLLYKPFAVFIKSTYDMGIGRIFHKFLTVFNLLVPEISTREKKGLFDPIYSYAFPNALASLLVHQLNTYAQKRDRRIENAKRFDRAFNFNHSGNYPVIRYPVLLENRDHVYTHAVRKYIFLGRWYDQVIAPTSVPLESMKYVNGSCPTAEQVSRTILNLPLDISPKNGEYLLTELKSS